MSQHQQRSIRSRLVGRIAIRALASVWLALAGTAVASPNYALFESGHVRPLGIAPSRNLLFAVNTPDNRLEIFHIGAAGQLTHLESVPVGLEPVAIGVRSPNEVWVVNHVSDSISIVNVRPNNGPSRVVRTLLVGDEPRDVVFAGPGRDRAFITAAHRGQNIPFDPQFTTPGVGRADVWVYNANQLSNSLNGGPVAILTLFTDTPRALAVTPDGSKVYAAGFNTGNRTSIMSEFTKVPFLGIPFPPAPAPTTNFEGHQMPEVSQIVKFDGAHWVDEIGQTYDQFVRFNLPDKDVFVIDAMTDPPAQVAGPSGYFQGVGTVLYNMVVNPVNGKVYVSNTEARNHVRFEGPGVFAGNTVRGHHNENRITVLSPGSVLPRHLNKHIDFSTCCASIPNAEGVKSLALPMQMAVSSNGNALYVAAMGSSKVGMFSTQQLEADTFVPNANHQVPLSGGGPTGLLLDESRNVLYVLTRFDNGISTVSTDTRTETAHVRMFSPESNVIMSGRRFLYNARLSSKGDSACATCHIFGDKDDLSWDLGNPDDVALVNNNPITISVRPDPVDPSFQPMKGPLATQSLRGMANHGPMHWRGDRTGSFTEPSVQPDSGAFNEHAAFLQFQKGFVGLLGRPGPLPDEDMQAFTSFVLQLRYPPNPIRNLDDSLTPAQAEGRQFFFDRVSVQNMITCQGCHRLDPAANSEFGVPFPGFFGTDGRSGREFSSQVFKIPHLRNLYTKVGMFGMTSLHPLIEEIPGQMGHMGDQIRGFGVSRAGDFDSIFRFIHATPFSTASLFAPNPEGFPAGPAGDPLRRKVEDFLLAFDTNLKPIVGQQVTASMANYATVAPRMQLLIARANAGDCDLVAKAASTNGTKGLLYLGGGSWRRDRQADGVVPTSAVQDLVLQGQAIITFTCTPPGTGLRTGIDRDGDGVLDGDDLQLN